jgi:hypothetical protein
VGLAGRLTSNLGAGAPRGMDMRSVIVVEGPHAWRDPDPGGFGRITLSLQARSGATVRAVNVSLSSLDVYRCFGPDDEKRVPQMMFALELPAIETGFRGGLYTLDDIEAIDIRIPPDRLSALKAAGSAGKQCRWMKRGGSGPECEATSPEDAPRMTTAAACEACETADDRFLCSDFVHPGTTGRVAGKGYIRELRRCFCDSGSSTPAGTAIQWSR